MSSGRQRDRRDREEAGREEMKGKRINDGGVRLVKGAREKERTTSDVGLREKSTNRLRLGMRILGRAMHTHCQRLEVMTSRNLKHGGRGGNTGQERERELAKGSVMGKRATKTSSRVFTHLPIGRHGGAQS